MLETEEIGAGACGHNHQSGTLGTCGDGTHCLGLGGPEVSVRKCRFAGLAGAGHRIQGAALLLLTTACESTIIPK